LLFAALAPLTEPHHYGLRTFAMSALIVEEQQIYFTRQEIQAWSGASGLKYLVAQWLSDGGFQEAFTALVSTLTRGKDLSSPTKRRKRAANQAYFAQLSGMFTKSAASSSKQKAVAIGAFSTSPINGASSSSGSGSGSSKKQKSPMSTMSSSTSLSSMSSSLSARTSSANESRTTYVLDLVKGLANQSERWTKIPIDEVLSIALLMDATDSYFVSWSDFFAFSTRIDEGLREDINAPAQQVRVLYDLMVQEKVARAEEGFRLPLVANDASTARLRALAMHARDTLRLNPLMMLFQLMNTNNQDSLSELDAVIESEALVMLFQHLGAHIGDESGVMKARIELSTKLNHAEAVFEASTVASSPASSKKKAKGKNSSPSSKGPASSSSSTPSSSSIPKGGIDPELDQDLFKLRENASAIAAKLASQSQNMEQTLSIWSALQALEKELVKASSTGSLVGLPGKEANTAVSNNKGSNSSSSSSVESSRKGSPSRRNLSLDTSYELDETAEDEEVVQVKSAQKQTLRTPSTNDRNVSSSSSSMLSSGGSISISSSSGKKKKPNQRLSSSSSASKRVNMTIFKSPSTHVHGNVNAYNNETYMWQPTLLTGKYNERFQTTHENMEAKKLFGRFFGGGEGL